MNRKYSYFLLDSDSENDRFIPTVSDISVLNIGSERKRINKALEQLGRFKYRKKG